MPIGKDNLKLMKSQRMTDNDDGGGRITGTQIIDNVSNEIFDDITDLDRVTGNVSLRKIYSWVDTTDTDGYFGANVILANTPDDPNVSITITKTDDFDDVRANAQEKIERYLVKANLSDYGLLGNHFQGQRSLNWFAIEQRTPPSPGETYYLESEDGLKFEYVRIVDVDAEIITFVKFDQNGNLKEYDAWNIVAEISAPLANDYIGGEADEVGIQPLATEDEEPAGIFTTQVADAARYYGIKPLTEPANIGDVTVKVESLFSNIVPAGTAERPIADEQAVRTRQSNTPSTLEPLTGSAQWATTGINSPKPIYLPTAVTPRTLVVTMNGGGGGTSVHEDIDGSGTLTRTSGSGYEPLVVDYDTGIITATAQFSGGGAQNFSYSYLPGEEAISRVISDLDEVTAVTRGFNYTKSFVDTKPRPGTLSIAYVVFGEWYEITDNGLGQLEGQGSGTVNYNTGTIAVTLQELPDVGSYVVYQFVPKFEDDIISIAGDIEKPLVYTIDLQNNFVANTVQIEYTSGGILRNVSASADARSLEGDATGTINPSTGVLNIFPDRVPDLNTTIEVNYETRTSEAYYVDYPQGDTSYTGTFPLAENATSIVKAGIKYTFSTKRELSNTTIFSRVNYQILTDGSGGFVYAVNGGSYQPLPNSTYSETTGAFSIQWPTQLETVRIYAGFLGPRYEDKNIPAVPNQADTANDVWVIISDNATTTAGSAVSLQTVNPQFYLPSSSNSVIPGTIAFDFLTQRYFDDREGNLVTNWNYGDGTSDIAGSVDYETGIVTITQWDQTGGLQTNLNVLTGSVFGPALQMESLVFRTLGTNIRQQSLSVRARQANNALEITAQADEDGVIDNAGITGTIEIETGLVILNFAIPVVPSSVFYNAVQLVFLPLDPEIVGLDPVRLPQDGRIPIYRTGDIVVVHNEVTTEIATPTANQVIDVGRTRLAEFRVYDANEDPVPSTFYTQDLDAGTLTLSDPLDTVTHPEPWQVIDRIEDTALINDVDISGEINLTRTISHDFPASTSYLSTAMVLGDLQARVTNVFDQATWTNEWSSELIGNEPSAEYDNTTYPIEVDNRGTLYQRWALVFTGSTSFNIIGETVGNVGVGNTSADIAPTNPNTSTPYFTIRSLGWGAGWAAGNVLRFDTISSNYPIWIARSVSQSNPTDTPDQFRLQVRGNINT